MAEGIFKLMLYLARAIFVFLGGVAGYQVVRIAVCRTGGRKGPSTFPSSLFFSEWSFLRL